MHCGATELLQVRIFSEYFIQADTIFNGSVTAVGTGMYVGGGGSGLRTIGLLGLLEWKRQGIL